LATLRLVPSPRQPEIIHRRHRRPLADRIAQAGEDLAVLEDDADWAELSDMLFGDDRIAEPLERDGNVIHLPRRRSTSFEILQVRQEEERRGKR
jgi:hypothetical protein